MQPTHTPVESERSWTASWIEPVEADDVAPAQRPAYHLATDFEVVGNVVRATLHATAHGVYEAYVNGDRVGNEELTPGFSAYRRRLQVQA
jgi:alpha-L-rhamnosidase